MKLNEMKAMISGVPEGFNGEKAKWDAVSEIFEIVKAAMLRRPARNKEGEIIKYEKGPRAGQVVPDWQVVLGIRTKSGKEYVVRTNSPKLVPLFTGEISDDREADSVNRFGDEIFNVDFPEGWLRFVGADNKYNDGRVGKVADLEQAED